MSERNTIIQRIHDLRQKGEGSNSEHEAHACLKMASKLMESYLITEAEIAMAENDGRIVFEVETQTFNTFGFNGRNRSVVHRVDCLVSELCETKHCYSPSRRRYHITGDKPDIEWAAYLLEIIEQSCAREYAKWKKTQLSVPRTAKGSFEAGYAHRVNQRLRDLIAARDEDRAEMHREAERLLAIEHDDAADIMARVAAGEPIPAADPSRELVIVSAVQQKATEVDLAFRKANPRLGTASGFGYSGNGDAYSAGRKAGASAHLGRGVGASSARQLT
jgi:hypothetical protein